MRYDVCDLSRQLWACWCDTRGWLTDWMTEEEYLRWWRTDMGCPNRTLPSRQTIYRADANRREAMRRKTA